MPYGIEKGRKNVKFNLFVVPPVNNLDLDANQKLLYYLFISLITNQKFNVLFKYTIIEISNTLFVLF